MFAVEALAEVAGQIEGFDGVGSQGQQPPGHPLGQGTPLAAVVQQPAGRSGRQLRQLGGVSGLAGALFRRGRGQGSQHLLHQLGGKAAEGDGLAAGADGAEQLLRGGGDQHQQAFAGLLQGLEQGVGGPLGHGLSPLQHHQAAARLDRSAGQKTRHLPHLLQPQLGGRPAAHPLRLGAGGGHQLALVGVGGFDPEQVWMVALGEAPPQDRIAHRSGLLPWRQHPLQEPQGGQASSHPIGPAEQVGGGQPAPPQRRLQQPHRQGLAQQISKELSHRPPAQTEADLASWPGLPHRGQSASAAGPGTPGPPHRHPAGHRPAANRARRPGWRSR